MTQSGIILLPLLMALLVLPRIWSIPALYIGAVLSDASIANPGGRPILVPWFVALIVIAREAWVIAIGQGSIRHDVLRRLTPLALFVLACCFSLVVALACFQGHVRVLPGSAGFNLNLTEPFHLMPENANQFVYLFIIYLLVLTIANIGASSTPEVLNAWIDRGMRWSCGLASLAVAWHVASFMFGIWFPEAFFHSNIKAGAWDQGGFGDLTDRPSGSFAEPSSLGTYCVMLLFYFWQQWRFRHGASDHIWFLIAVAVLLLSTSTTAYAGFGIFTVLAAVDWIMARVTPGRPERVKRPFLLRRTTLLSSLIILTFLGAGAVFLKQNAATVSAIVDGQANKNETTSYTERFTADRIGWQIFLDTYGLGVGLGSHRPNSGVVMILSSSGILGLLALMSLFLKSLPGTQWRARNDRYADDPSKPIRWASIGLLLLAVTNGPDIQSIMLWTSLGLAVAFRVNQRDAADLESTRNERSGRSRPSGGPGAWAAYPPR